MISKNNSLFNNVLHPFCDPENDQEGDDDNQIEDEVVEESGWPKREGGNAWQGLLNDDQIKSEKWNDRNLMGKFGGSFFDQKHDESGSEEGQGENQQGGKDLEGNWLSNRKNIRMYTKLMSSGGRMDVWLSACFAYTITCGSIEPDPEQEMG